MPLSKHFIINILQLFAPFATIHLVSCVCHLGCMFLQHIGHGQILIINKATDTTHTHTYYEQQGRSFYNFFQIFFYTFFSLFFSLSTERCLFSDIIVVLHFFPCLFPFFRLIEPKRIRSHDFNILLNILHRCRKK